LAPASTVVIGPGIDYRGLDRLLAELKEFVVMRWDGPLSVALSNCRKLSPCILVINQSDLESLDPEEMANTLGQGGTIKILVRAREDSEALTERVLRSGCMGVLPFSASPTLVRRAILRVDSGEYWASRKVISRMLQNSLEVERSNLTPREREILKLIGLEYTNEKIANELFISPETVRWHLRSLYAKIGIHDRRAAAVFARANTSCSSRRGGFSLLQTWTKPGSEG
jgi:DNA-binding NarL/FixJ family response regulator